MRCQQAGVPITNYGLTIAYSLGIFARALEPFPAALAAFRSLEKSALPHESLRTLARPVRPAKKKALPV
jgi:hypothetical protein